MIEIATLKTALASYIGFRQPVTAQVSVSTALATSVSGQYWDDFHPLLHTDNLYYCAPQGPATGVTASVFNTWLGERVNASIGNLFNRLATNKKLSGSTKSIFANYQLFTGAGRLTDQITKSGRLVGLAIVPRNINNIRVVVNQVGLQLSSVQTGLPVYLWHSSRVATVDSMTVVTSRTDSFDWQAADFSLDFVNYANDIDPGGTWYVGYFENDITGNAIRKSYDFYSGPCRGCKGSMENVTRFDLWSKYVDVIPFSCKSTHLSGVNFPDIENLEYDDTNNFGLNLALTVKPDVTELITSNLQILAYPLGLQFAYDTLHWMLLNPSGRINPLQNNSQSVLDYELSGDKTSNKRGLLIEVERAIDALAEDLSNISAALPSNRPSGIEYGVL
jgi:hypothetical protein